jgi:hypothetical protein
MMSAPVTFVDERLDIVELPVEPEGYGIIGGHSSRAVLGYALADSGRYILMLADGTVPRGEDGQYIGLFDDGHNSSWFPHAGSAVVTLRDGLFGLYNVEERREVLPNEYDLIEIIDDALFLAAKGRDENWVFEKAWLFDDRGRDLYTFGEVEYGYGLVNTRGRQSYGSKYYLNIEQRVFFRYADYSQYDAGQIILRAESSQETKEIFEPVYWDDAIGGRNLRDVDGNILLSVPNEDGWLFQRGSFALLEKWDGEMTGMRSNPYAVYNIDGELLLSNVYGYIWDVLGPNGGMFVYLDPNTCVLLYSDGRTVPVPNAPVVELVYWGG